MRYAHGLLQWRGTQWDVSSAATAKDRVRNASGGLENDFRHAWTCRKSAAPDGKPIEAPAAPKRWIQVLELITPCPRPLLGMSPPTTLAIGATVEHMGSHTVSLRAHVCAFKRSCDNYDSCNTPYME